MKRIIFVLAAILWSMAVYGADFNTSSPITYTDARFKQLIDDSYKEHKAGYSDKFYAWMNKATKSKYGFENVLDEKGKKISKISSVSERTKAEIVECAWSHKLIKSIIPKFSLDRGFEFYHAHITGERQCFLQSVLIAGMLQEMGIRAGVAMVYRNEKGEYTNNGHAVTLVKLSDKRDIIVDASDAKPFAKHQGLFLKYGTYIFALPHYMPKSSKIDYFTLAANMRKIKADKMNLMDYGFIRSQFYYYRGEREPGALLSNHRTKNGLLNSEKYFRKSVEYCSQNPLAVYMLGRVYLEEHKLVLAKKALLRSINLYSRFGWIPEGPKEYLKAANS